MLVYGGDTVKATPTGPSRTAALRPRETAAVLLSSLFQQITDWTGDFPGTIFDHEGVA